MYVKITNKQEKENTVYEADGVKVNNSKEYPGMTAVWVERVDDSFTVNVPCDGTHEIYLMNEEGRTIDRYQLKDSNNA